MNIYFCSEILVLMPRLWALPITEPLKLEEFRWLAIMVCLQDVPAVLKRFDLSLGCRLCKIDNN